MSIIGRTTARRRRPRPALLPLGAPARFLLPLTAALLASACIVGRTDHSLYLGKDGAVTWTVVARDLRSDAGDAAERASEEADFLAQVAAGEHPAAAALRSLGGEVGTTLVRDERPFVLVTSGRFRRIDELAEAYFRALGIPAEARFRQRGALRELTVEVHLAEEDEDLADDAILALVDEPQRFRIVLEEGRFTGAVGFHLEERDAVAVPLGLDDDALAAMGQPDAATVLLALRWRIDR
ncbi:MAG: hypothetical protein D6696_10215 [Acidobacteria bacterium]|nr:MAG: hypothetical protein D6696_10215 [Acidobacteriota bacterium]